MSPNVIEPPSAALRPPYQTNRPIATDDDISAIGKKIELYQTVFTQAFLCFSFISLNFSNSSSSLVKI